MKQQLLKSCAALLLGAAIIMPAGVHNASADTIYTATDNDTFWKLSQKHNIPLKTLMAANAKIDPLNIYKGLKLVLPGVTPVTAQSSTNEKVITASGQSVAYKKKLELKASAYTAAAEENGIWGPVDYFGNPLKVGTVAVDPNIIPLGTKLYVTGYDYAGLPAGGFLATALDTGGAIKGNRIDIFVPDSRSQAMKFGFQNVQVYVLE